MLMPELSLLTQIQFIFVFFPYIYEKYHTLSTDELVYCGMF